MNNIPEKILVDALSEFSRAMLEMADVLNDLANTYCNKNTITYQDLVDINILTVECAKTTRVMKRIVGGGKDCFDA